MANDTLSRIEDILKDAQALTPEKKAELLGLLAKLRQEMEGLDPAHAREAENFASQARALTLQALSPDHDRETLRHALSGLAGSLQRFEQSHPQLVQITNRICTALSNFGI